MKRLLASLCLLAVAFSGTAQATEETSQSGSYTTSIFFLEDCDMGIGVACFTIFRDDISSIHIDVADQWPFPVTAYAEVFGPGGTWIGGGNQFCGSGDVTIPDGAAVASIVVHVGGFMQDECGPIPFVDPFEGKTGSFTPATVGTVTITY